MKLIFYKMPLFIVMLMILSGVGAYANESTESSSESEPGVVVKVEKGIERGAKATARGIERGAKSVARGVKRGARATGNAAHSLAKKIGGSSTKSSSSDK